MTTNISEKTLRDKYFANEIFRIGELVEDVSTGEHMKIIDRGSNYVTVATSTGVTKKWLNEVKEEITPAQVVTETVILEAPKDFTLLESGQIKLFGYETKNFDSDLSKTILEQFSEFDDLYSKHQIIKCLDIAISENNIDDSYSLIQKVEGFYSKQDKQVPFILEAMKTDIERRRIVEILANVAGIKAMKSNQETVVKAIRALKNKYADKKQWEVLWPFFQMAYSAGITGFVALLPFTFGNIVESEDDIVIDALEDNIGLLEEDLHFDDIFEAFTEEEMSGDLLTEVLSIETRAKLGREMKKHETVISVKRERALNKAATSDVLLARARRLAETMIKRRMFHKPGTELTRGEKERFEAGISKRRALVAKLAQRLVGKVRALQSARLHHNNTPASHTHDLATAKIASGSGAS